MAATHHFSGWPGAVCLHCGSGDPNENALAIGWLEIDYDENGEPCGTHFDTPEHEALIKQAMTCKVGWAKDCGQCQALEARREP